MQKDLKSVLGIFLDTETNGLNFFKHKILEVAIKVYDLLSKDELLSYETKIWTSFENWQESDLNSLSVTGFTYNEIEKGKKIDKVKDQIIKQFQEINISKENSVFICQNPSFDRIFFSQIVSPDEQEILKWPYHWLDLASMFFSTKIQQEKNHVSLEIDLSKDNIAVEYNIEKEERPHRAMNGVIHLVKCYEKVVGFPLSKQNNTPVKF